jgi:hypothetical protein
MTGGLTLRIILEQPPAGVDFGLQEGRGSDYRTVQVQRSNGGDLAFECAVAVKPGPDFGGPFVQGPKGGRFLYIDIGTYAGQKHTPWSRRLKIPLAGLGPEGVFEARVPGAGRDGGPTCGTVKPFSGWKLRRE